MNQSYDQILDLVNAVWKRRWRAIIVAWAVCVVGWMVVISKPDTYTSTTRIFVDTASVLKPLLKGLAIEEDVGAELEVMKRTLTTRANLEKVARLTDLDITATTPEKMQRLLDGLKSRTSIKTDGRFLLSISYTDRDPVLARDVTQAFSQIFIESNLGEKRAEIEDAQIFLDRQIAQYERALGEAEERLAKFKDEKLSALPDLQNYQFRMDELRAEIDDVMASLQRARARETQLRQQLAKGPTVAVADNSEQIFEAEKELTELLTRYKERHPDVVAQRRKIAALKEMQRASGQTALGSQDSTSDVSGISVSDYQQLKLALGQVESDIAVHQDRAGRLRARLRRMQTLAAKIPDTEVELARLNRDYDVLNGKHSELLARREQARMSRDREAGAERIQYEILDAPRVPAIPNGPSRSMLISAVFIVGLGAGIGFAILLSFLNNSISDPARLREVFGMTVLGTVSMVQSLRQQTWQFAKLSSFIAVSSMLFAGYGLIMLTENRVGFKNIVPEAVLENVMDQIAAMQALI